MRLTIDAYKALYCSSVAFGMRKSLQTEQGKSELKKDVETLKEEKAELDIQIFDLRQKFEQADRRAAEMRLAEEKKHNEEIAFLKKTNQQLKVFVTVFIQVLGINICYLQSQLEGIIAPKK